MSLAFDHPRIDLGGWPTPVHRLEETSRSLGVEVWTKREDLCGAWGGNKVRKLEYWLADERVRRAGAIIVTGAGASTWAAAAALHAKERGLDVVAALAGEMPADRRDLYGDLGVRLVHSRNLNAMPLVVARAQLGSGRGAERLPMGGSGWPGDLGSLRCGLEVADHEALPTGVFVACGTAGTAAGIAAGLALRGKVTPVIAVRVAPRPLGTARMVRRRATKLLRKIGEGPLSLAVMGNDDFFGQGYGAPGPGLDEAMELSAADGLELERTYTGKAFAALIAHARRGAEGPLLFVHTATAPL